MHLMKKSDNIADHGGLIVFVIAFTPSHSKGPTHLILGNYENSSNKMVFLDLSVNLTRKVMLSYGIYIYGLYQLIINILEMKIDDTKM